MKKVFLFLLAAMVAVGATAQVHRVGKPHDRDDNRHRPPMEHHQQIPPAINCASPEQMEMVIKVLKQQSFDEKKLEIAELCVNIGHFCTDDLAQIATVFSFDENRLEFFKYAYAYCLDKEQYPMLRTSFTFSSNFDALMDFIYPNSKR